MSEAARAFGARLVNGLGERFVDELQPRDVVTAAILREMAGGRAVSRDGKTGVLLDTPTLEREKPGIFDHSLITLKHLAERSGFDPVSEPFLVGPTLHYQNGGLAIETAGRTTIPACSARAKFQAGCTAKIG